MKISFGFFAGSIVAASLLACIGQDFFHRVYAGPSAGPAQAAFTSARLDQVGRFQLAAATVIVDRVATPRLFRIDTVTGQVSRYESTELALTILTNRVPVEIEAWVKVPETDTTTQANEIMRTATGLGFTNAP